MRERMVGSGGHEDRTAGTKQRLLTSNLSQWHPLCLIAVITL